MSFADAVEIVVDRVFLGVFYGSAFDIYVDYFHSLFSVGVFTGNHGVDGSFPWRACWLYCSI